MTKYLVLIALQRGARGSIGMNTVINRPTLALEKLFFLPLNQKLKNMNGLELLKQKENRELSSVAHQSELFLHADTDMISIGGGNGHGLMLDYELQFGKTERCDTFNNLPLCSTPDFEIKVVEVFSLGQVF
ncbi:TBC1 domain family member 24 [Armadillidium vulgare]|nr:TBC1 domain family member 24 [Armadillidium vulgare]